MKRERREICVGPFRSSQPQGREGPKYLPTSGTLCPEVPKNNKREMVAYLPEFPVSGVLTVAKPEIKQFEFVGSSGKGVRFPDVLAAKTFVAGGTWRCNLTPKFSILV